MTYSSSLGTWQSADPAITGTGYSVRQALQQINQPLYLLEGTNSLAVATSGTAQLGAPATTGTPLLGFAPPCLPQHLGNPGFCADLSIRYAYVGGSMAKGISSVAMALELGRAGMLGCFGAAGLPLATVEAAIDQLLASGLPFGVNLIHSPQEPDLEEALVALYLRKQVRLVEASAFLALSLNLVRYRVHGIHRAPDGAIVTPNRLLAKVSREELAERFFSPPPEKFLKELVANGDITSEQAELASRIPMAQDVTAEADSGGHTDNRPALALFPTILSLAGRLQAQYNYPQPLRVGLGGGIGTPAAAAAAFTMGAAYVMVGSVHQACLESGTSNAVHEMLAQTRQADVAMAPAADMFEMGVTVQVLKRGTMFPMRAAKLYEIYRSYAGIDDIPQPEREKLEKTLFLAPLADIWQQTRTFFLQRDPRQVERGDQDPKHRMALVFRWYLGQGAHWAKDGDPARKVDYQVWCGPAMGAFNEWAAGSFLETAANRRVATVARNLLYGASVLTRAYLLRSQGIALSTDLLRVEPLDEAQLKEFFGEQ